MVKRVKKQTARIKKETARRTLIPKPSFVPFFTSDILPIPPAVENFKLTSLERAIIPRIHFDPIVRG